MKQTDTETSTPLNEQAFNGLRRDVMTGAFEPGRKLKLDELQSMYGFSSSPLREALSRLSQEGLIRADERRGFRVCEISEQDLRDITQMRVLLDPQALAKSIRLGDDAWEAGVVAAHYKLEKIERSFGDGPLVLDLQWIEAHKGFHMSLIDACDSLRLKQWCSSLFDQAERYRQFSARFRKTNRRKSHEHKKIMDAVIKRDVKTATALWVEHIHSTQENVLAALRASS